MQSLKKIGTGGDMHWFGGYGMGYGSGGFFMIFFWGLIILAVFYLIKALAGGTSTCREKAESAEEVLAKRFARGEMTKDAFEEAVEVLKKHSL